MKKLSFSLFIALALFLSSCDTDRANPDTLTLNLSGLEDLGPDYAYEGWLIVNGNAVTSGVFTVDATGKLSTETFTVDPDDLENASSFVLTIEPMPDNDPAPSSVHILAGDFSDRNASLSVGHGSALGDDYGDASGKYILATPTDADDSNENSGVWFLDPMAGPGPGLNLPQLPAGWVYEGWAVINGTPVTTGQFTQLDQADGAAPFSGTMAGPPFPGEDFLANAPAGLSFPTDLSEATIVVSIEPSPDNSPAPFTLKPLVGNVPANAADHTAFELGQNLGSFPSGTAVK